ncbi:MAG: response regulator transcription factor [Ignavibacteriae bacterium]|nr:response regulator transcription factor [Ignavibacteriota bacterium]
MIRILIADDHPLIRNGLRQLISKQSDIEIACEASNAEEVFDMMKKHKIDVLILDISMPGMSGIEILDKVKQKYPSVPVLMLSALSEELYALKTLKSGASGFINKEAAPEELVKAIRKVYSGGVYVSDFLGEKLAVDFKKGTAKEPHEKLSKREFQIMCLIGSGKTVSEIANELFLNVRTISTYRARILGKLNLKNNSEITSYCMKEGFTL